MPQQFVVLPFDWWTERRCIVILL